MNKKEAIKIAIECMKEVRQRRHAFNSNLYHIYQVESQKKHYDKYVEISEAIRIIEEMK